MKRILDVKNLRKSRSEKMKKKNNGLFILVLCLIILLGSTIFLLEVAKYPKDRKNDENKEEVSRKLEESDIRKYEKDFSSLFVYTMVNNKIKNGSYALVKDKNLLEDIESRQYFALDYLMNTNQEQFIIVNGFNNEKDDTLNTTDDGVLLYYKKDGFQSAYQEIFGEDFDLSARKVSAANNHYDLSLDYLYYDSKLSGMNGVSATILIDKLESDKAYVTVEYSDRMQELLLREKDNGIITFSSKGRDFYLKEFKLI